MKKLILPVLMSLVLFTGCSLIPKRVEFFQDKVKKVPVPSQYEKELQKETAALAKQKAKNTVLAAVDTGASPSVLAPAKEAEVLTDSLSSSLGVPDKAPAPEASQELAAKLTHETARLDLKIDKVREEMNKDAGKKIEGTGKIQIPYFFYAGGIVLLIVVGWHLAHTALTLASAANPGAAVGVAGMNVAGAVAAKGFHQLVLGGESFKDWVEKEVTDPSLKEKVLSAFTSLHKQAQDADIKQLVKHVNGQ